MSESILMRRGLVRLPDQLLMEDVDPGLLKALWSRIFPTRMVSNEKEPWKAETLVYALSPLFREVELLNDIPEYVAICTREDNGSVTIEIEEMNSDKSKVNHSIFCTQCGKKNELIIES